MDLTNAFDTVSRDGLWKIMSKFGCSHKFITIVRQFNEGMQARVLDDGEPSESFPVSSGVMQGCVLAPTLFSLMFSAMLTGASRDCDAAWHQDQTKIGREAVQPETSAGRHKGEGDLYCNKGLSLCGRQTMRPQHQK